MSPATGTVAVVTGSAGMIAGAVARGIAAGGGRIVLVDRCEQTAARFAGEVEELGGEAVAVVADLTTAEGAARAVDAAIERWGRLDALVNVAGGIKGPIHNPFWEMTDEQWQRTVATNLDTVYHCCRRAIPVMMAQRSGRIVNIVSTSWAGSPDHAHYAAAKAAVVALTRSLATQLGPHQVTVNAVAPGGTLTDAAALPGFPSPEQWVSMNPLGRPNTAEDVAAAVLFLLGEGARNISGQLLTVAAGLNPSL